MMDQLFRILKAAGENPLSDQRSLAAACGVSVGKINSLIHTAEEGGYLQTAREGKKSRYTLTRTGKEYLEHTLLSRRETKLPLEPGEPVRTAVILAAGRRKDFDLPPALLQLEEHTVIDRMMKVLENGGIEHFIITAGYQAEELKKKFAGRQNVQVIENTRYKWTGSMKSLALAAEHLDLKGGNTGNSFLVLKSDLVFEQRAVDELLHDDSPFAAVLAGPSGSGEEIFVELDEFGGIFRLARDIRQVNCVQGEFIGIAKVSSEVLEGALEYFQHNQNPLLSFEYVLENIGRLYRFSGVLVDDLVWGRIRDRKSYERIVNLTCPRILRKEREMREQLAASAVCSILSVDESQIETISFAGGLTNTNYFVQVNGERYILRLPGRMTESMICRSNEERNAQIASDRGLNCRLVYFDSKTGIKLSAYIDGAETLNPRTARLEENISKTADILRRLHTSDIVWENRFDPFEEAKKYERLLDDPSARMYKGFDALRLKTETILKSRLIELGWDQLPCHNDLVAANLVRDRNGRLYLIDWEYSGQNDPMFDIAALFLENGFTPEDEELFFQHYYQGGKQPENCREKILIFKIVQDYLWSLWTVLKESRGDDFGSYGFDRFSRAVENMSRWEHGEEAVYPADDDFSGGEQ